jgi:hypothetical protein
MSSYAHVLHRNLFARRFEKAFIFAVGLITVITLQPLI